MGITVILRQEIERQEREKIRQEWVEKQEKIKSKCFLDVSGFKDFYVLSVSRNWPSQRMVTSHLYVYMYLWLYMT